jgi:membrane-bound serine protease (ClpP class)
MDIPALPYTLIAVGMVLMAAELFLPTHGVLFGLGLGGVLIGVALSFDYGLPTGLTTLVIVVVVLPAFGGLLLRIWPKTPMGKSLFLPGPDDDAAVAAMPVNLELEALRGKFGKTLSALRPCGLVDFDGRRVDTMTGGEMIEPNQWVRCVDIKAGRVIVRQVPRPPDLGEMDTAVFGGPNA